MKNLTIVFLIFFIFNIGYSQTTFWMDDFNGAGPSMGGGDRDAPNHADRDNGSGTGICGLGDYFYRTSDSGGSGNPLGLDSEFTGFTGSYWRGEDLDGCIANPDVIDFTGINISSLTNLGFTGSFASRPDNIRYEADDFIRVEYSIDGAAFATGIIFESDLSNGTNGELREDTNGDGTGNGTTPLGPAFNSFSFLIPGSGTTLALKITVDIDGPGEEFGFEDFIVQHSIPPVLPVELISFKGTEKDNSINLHWITASEINNEKFEIEHRTNNNSFEKIGEVAGNRNTSQISSYVFPHHQPSAGDNYYRLKQIDFDGQFEFSEVISLHFEVESDYVGAFYPNPSHSGLVNLTYTTNQSTKFHISVFDITGRLILKQVHFVSTGKKVLNLDFSSIKTGAYIVKIDDGIKFTYRKLIIE